MVQYVFQAGENREAALERLPAEEKVEDRALSCSAEEVSLHHGQLVEIRQKSECHGLFSVRKAGWRMGDSNPRPTDCEPAALPTELIPRRLAILADPPILGKYEDISCHAKFQRFSSPGQSIFLYVSFP